MGAVYGSRAKKTPDRRAEGEKPFCCHTSRHPLREEKRGAASRSKCNVPNIKIANKSIFVF
jgi:hypothetical protein